MSILSVEDDEFMRIFLKDIFWMHGTPKNLKLYQVESIQKAKEFLTDRANKIPDLILLDVRLPEKDGENPKNDAGLVFLKELRLDPKTKDKKIVIFSGFSDKELREEALRLGADKFLVKGEHMPAELIQITEEVLKNK